MTIGGVPFKHLVYRFVLPYSNWEHVTIASSETFEALVGGLQESLWALGGVPREHRTDNLSAATHELRQSGGRACNRAYADFLAHYGLEASRNYPGNAHENGDVESAHGHFKTALEQRLRLSGTRDFGSVEQYLRVLEELAEQRNSRRGERLAAERAALRALPSRRLPVYREERRTVTRGSVVRVASKVYSVPSRLIGERLVARLYADRVELRHGGELVVRHERAVGKQLGRVDYRHIVHSLLRKPGAFAQWSAPVLVVISCSESPLIDFAAAEALLARHRERFESTLRPLHGGLSKPRCSSFSASRAYGLSRTVVAHANQTVQGFVGIVEWLRFHHNEANPFARLAGRGFGE